MNKNFLISIITFVFLFCGTKVKADLIITNYTPIQYNIVLSDGSYIGISATSPAFYTYPSSTYPTYTAAILQYAKIYPHEFWPVLTVGDIESVFPFSATYSMIVPPMTTPFTVTYMELGSDVYLSFYP